jgi:Na+/proline symporter
MNRALAFTLGAVLLVALDAAIIATARAVDPGAPVIFLSNLAAVFIGAIQLLYGVPLVLWLRRRRPGVAVGVGAGMAVVLVVNAIALYR